MKLSVRERLGLLELMPQEGGYAALKSLRRAKETLAITPEEAKEFDFIQTPVPGGKFSFTWDVGKEKIKEIPIDEYTTDTVRDILVKKEKEGKLNEQTFSIYEKFVVAYRNTEVAHK